MIKTSKITSLNIKNKKFIKFCIKILDFIMRGEIFMSCKKKNKKKCNNDKVETLLVETVKKESAAPESVQSDNKKNM